MSKTLRSFEQVSQHFKCPIHLGKLKDPRRLPCEHTLCRDCLKDLIKSALKKESSQGMFECPECRVKVHIPTTETQDWADWFPVDAFCLIQLKTLARFQDSQVCEVHEDKFKEYYCFHHRELYCPDCIIDKHTNNPCYARNCKDATGDVKKHLNDLIGQLRLQEERAQRVAESKVAATHTDDLLQKIWEVDHLVERFQKTMKKKLNEAKIQIEKATKISPADKSHLKTTQNLISQTKRLVEEKLRNVNTKTKDGQNDLLRLWKPLDDQVDHFARVLNAVEKRPFCVNVQVDEGFMEFITASHEALEVLNGSMQWTPLQPTIQRENSAKTMKSNTNRSLSFKEPLQTPRSQVTSRSTGEASASFPRSRAGYRTLPLQTKQKTPRATEVFPLPSIQQKLQERNPTILPKLTTGGLSSGELSKTFTVRSLKLRGISQQSVFEFPCEDILVLDNNIITISERAVQKFSLRYQFLQSLALRAPIKLCPAKDDTHNILVLDNSCGISLIATQPRLQIYYRIETDRAYTGLCHMRTTMTEDAYGHCLYHLHVALMHVWNREDCIDVMVVTYEQRNNNKFGLGLIDEVTLTPTKVKTICGSNDDASLRNMTSICTAPDNRKLLIGSEFGVVCMNRSGDIIWTYPAGNTVSSVDSRRGLVFAAVEKSARVFILDQHGNLLLDNVFPGDSTIQRPVRVSLGKSSMIAREFIDLGQQGIKKNYARVFILDQHGNLLLDNVFPGDSTIQRPTRVSLGKSSLIAREFIDLGQQGIKSMVHVFILSYA